MSRNLEVFATLDKGLPEPPAKPCCKRLGNRYCAAPDGHAGDCEYLGREEFPPSDLGPRWKPRWAR